MKLLIGTRNEGKAREIRELFAGLPFTLVTPAEQYLERLPEEAELEESPSYVENATSKARYFAQRGALPTIAEDSGLEVDALDGAPGPRSARWAGVAGAEADAANNARLLEALSGVPEVRRTARYRCVVGFLATPTSVPEIVEATSEGVILSVPRGSGGFGYDPLFYSPELRQSFAEAPAASKHRVSHRGRAVRALIEVLVRRST